MSLNALENSVRPVILLAEDDPDQSDMLREVLEDEGYRVETAFSGDAAMHKLEQCSYDLIILDIRMPGLDGSGVLKACRNLKHRKAAPIIVVSAFASASELKQYRAEGAAASLAKPYAIDELLSTAAALVSKSGPAGQTP